MRYRPPEPGALVAVTATVTATASFPMWAPAVGHNSTVATPRAAARWKPGHPGGWSLAARGAPYPAHVAPIERRTGEVESLVREWRSEEGWGVLDSAETPGGCWAHYSSIAASGYREVCAGQRVRLKWESPGQDGYDFRAVRIIPQQ
jgi:CspA family cold shock protein